MIEPTPGRVVWYHPAGSHPTAQPHAAHVAFVHDAGLVNLMVISHDGIAYPATEIPLLQGGEQLAEGMAPRGYAEWMPFQKGQAAKTDAAKLVADLALDVDAKFKSLGDWLNPRLADIELKVSGSTSPPNHPPPAAPAPQTAEGSGAPAPNQAPAPLADPPAPQPNLGGIGQASGGQASGGQA
jgi:hypothetical protein